MMIKGKILIQDPRMRRVEKVNLTANISNQNLYLMYFIGMEIDSFVIMERE